MTKIKRKPSNLRRIKKVRDMLGEFYLTRHPTSEQIGDALESVLADLMHYANWAGFSWQHRYSAAENTYYKEGGR